MCAAYMERENNKAQTDNPRLKWPTLMNDLFHELQRLRKESLSHGLDRISEDVLLSYLERYDVILKTGAAEDFFPLIGKKQKRTGNPGSWCSKRHRTCSNATKDIKEKILRFATDFAFLSVIIFFWNVVSTC